MLLETSIEKIQQLMTLSIHNLRFSKLKCLSRALTYINFNY